LSYKRNYLLYNSLQKYLPWQQREPVKPASRTPAPAIGPLLKYTAAAGHARKFAANDTTCSGATERKPAA